MAENASTVDDPTTAGIADPAAEGSGLGADGSTNPPAAPTPQLITADALVTALKPFADALAEQRDALAAVTERVLTPQAAPVQAPTLPVDVSNAEIDAAVQRGEGTADLIERRVNARVAVIEQKLQAQLGQLREVGLGTMSTLVADRLASKKHYATYRGEIDAIVSKLPAEAKANPATLEHVYRTVVGGHADEIEARAVEEAVRKAKEPVATPQRGSTNARTVGAERPRLEDVVDAATLRMIESKGGVSRFAKDAGMTDDEYVDALVSRATGQVH